MNIEQAIERLRNDEDYYGDFGKQFLSNSDISVLENEPHNFHKQIQKTPNLLVGGYFHTAILEPGKLHNFKIVKASNRNTNIYKDECATEGEIHLLESEADMVMKLKDRLLACEPARDLIMGSHGDSKIEYEVPNIIKLGNNYWKGKADIINHDERLVIDLKTTSDLDRFKFSASKYNYDSQAFIYSQMFGYDFLFIVIDKKTMKIKFAECSPEFYQRGAYKVEKANELYDLFIKDENFNMDNFFITETL